MNYNTDINILGSIPDYHLIYSALPLLIDNEDELHKKLVENNEFNFRTEKSRTRFLALLRSAFISDNKEINELAAITITNLKNDENSQAIILFWLFSSNNPLFYELNRDVFLKYYFQGRTDLPKDIIIAYINDLISRHKELKGKWSKKTIDTLASKYLTILKKLHLLEGRQKKSFCFVRINDELLAVFVHLYTIAEHTKINALEDEFLNFSFIPNESILERFKKIAKKDWIKMNYTGTSLNIEGSFKNNEIINGIYRRA